MNKALGLLVALGGTIGGVLIMMGSIALGSAVGLIGAGGGIVVIVGSILSGIGLVASGEWMDLHIRIEENTRSTTAAELVDAELRWVA